MVDRDETTLHRVAFDADARVAASEYRYRSLVENLPGTVAIMFDRDLRFVLVDGPEVEATGFSKEAMEGRTLREAVPADFADMVEPNLRRVLNGERFSAELPFGDRTYHYEYVPLRRDRDGAVEHALILGQNVTERVRAARVVAEREEQYRTLAEHLPDLIVRFDRDARLVFVNPVIERAVGRPVADVLGRRLVDLPLDPTLAASWTASVAAVFATGRPAAREDDVNGPSGPRRWAARLVPEPATGPVESVLVLSRDITTDHQAELERRALEARLRQAGKLDALGRLAGGVAHDFNNLLTAIQGYAYLLVRNPTIDAAAREDLDEISRAAERGSSLTAQLLAFSRKHATELTLVDVDGLVGEALRMLERLMGEDVTIAFAAGARDPVQVDPGQLEQVLVNLAVNARDAMPRGGRLSVTTASVEVDGHTPPGAGVSPGRYVHLQVRDSGVGMSPETLEHLYEPFFTTKEPGKGTGLGLSIIYGIVRKHGGFIEASSVLGAGSTFDIYLPAHDRGKASTPHHPTAPAAHRAARILLVEDERAVLNVAARVLRDHGYEVHAAGSPAEALALTETGGLSIDLVLTDVIMPGMNGPELVERLRARLGPLKVLYMSGYTDDALAQAGLRDGSIQFLQKPFVVGALIAKVSAVLELAPAPAAG